MLRYSTGRRTPGHDCAHVVLKPRHRQKQQRAHLVFPAPSCPTSTTLIMIRGTGATPSANRSAKYSDTAAMPFFTTASGGSCHGLLCICKPSASRLSSNFDNRASSLPSCPGMDTPALADGPDICTAHDTKQERIRGVEFSLMRLKVWHGPLE